MGTKKGNRRKFAAAGARLAYDALPKKIKRNSKFKAVRKVARPVANRVVKNLEAGRAPFANNVFH